MYSQTTQLDTSLWFGRRIIGRFLSCHHHNNNNKNNNNDINININININNDNSLKWIATNDITHQLPSRADLREEVHKWAILWPHPIPSTDFSKYSYIHRSPFLVISKPSFTKFVKFINESLAYKYVRYICNGIIIIQRCTIYFSYVYQWQSWSRWNISSHRLLTPPSCCGKQSGCVPLLCTPPHRMYCYEDNKSMYTRIDDMCQIVQNPFSILHGSYGFGTSSIRSCNTS